MPATLPKSERSSLVNTVEPRMAKAQLPSQARSIGSVLKDALQRHYGSLKAAAITLEMDQGQLTRELQTGAFKVRRLDRDQEARVFVLQVLHEEFGADNPQARTRRLIREARHLLDELEAVNG